jgi:hypothetical protein
MKIREKNIGSAAQHGVTTLPADKDDRELG